MARRKPNTMPLTWEEASARKRKGRSKPVADPGEPHVIEHGNPGEEEVETLRYGPGSPAFVPALHAPGKRWGFRRIKIRHTTPDGLIWEFTLHQAIPDNMWQLVRAETVPVQVSVSGLNQIGVAT